MSVFNVDFTRVFDKRSKEFEGHSLLEYGVSKDGYGIFAQATSTVAAGNVFINPANATITATSTPGFLAGYLETALTGTATEPEYIFVRCFGKNSAGAFIVPSVVAGA